MGQYHCQMAMGGRWAGGFARGWFKIRLKISSKELLGSIRELLILKEKVCSHWEMLYLFWWQLPLY